LKALVKISSNPEEHKLSFNLLKEYFKTKYDIELEGSSSEIRRLCFVPWDENLNQNTNSEKYFDKLIVKAINETTSKKSTLVNVLIKAHMLLKV